MIKNHPEVAAAHEADDLAFGTVDSWVLYVRAPVTMSHSNQDPTAEFSPRTPPHFGPNIFTTRHLASHRRRGRRSPPHRRHQRFTYPPHEHPHSQMVSRDA